MCTKNINRREALQTLGTGALVAGSAVFMPSVVRGQSSVTIRAAHVESASGGTNLTLLRMAELVAERSSGEITIEAFPDGVLSGGSGQVGIDQLVTGATQMVPTSTAYFSTLEPKLSAFSLPFAFSGYEEYYAALRGPLSEALSANMPSKGLEVVGWWPRLFRQLWASELIKKPEQLEGVRIRTINNPLYVETFKALGARPTPMAWGEVYTALQLNAIDAVEPDLSGGYLAKFQDVVKHVTTWNYSNDALMVVYNKSFWDGLSETHQQILSETADEMVDYKAELDQKLEATAVKALKADGVQIEGLTDAEQQAFKDRVQPVWQNFEPVFGKEILDLL